MSTSVRRRIRDAFGSTGIQIEHVEAGFQYLLILFFSIATLVPLTILLLQAISEGSIVQSLTLDVSLNNFRSALRSGVFWDAIKNTFIFSLGSVFIGHLLGFTFAFILTRLEVPHSQKFHTLMFLPIFVSPLVLSLGFSFSFSDGGYYDLLMDMLGVSISINNVYGMVLISSVWLTPFAYSFMSAGLQNIDPEMEDAARITGAADWKVLTNVSIPLLKPFALSSLFLTILLTFQEISIPAILGLPDRIYVLSTYLLALQSRSVPPPYGVMAAVGIIMVVISLVLVVLISRIIGDVSKYTVITGRGRERTMNTSTPVSYAAAAFLAAYLFLFLFVPLFQVISIGLTTGGGIGVIELPKLSPTHFVELFERDTFKTAIKNTVTIALVTASIAVVVTGVISYIVNRTEGLSSSLLGKLAWIPISTPGVVLGLAYLWTVLVFQGIGLYGTVLVLGIAFFVRFSAIGMRMNNSLISQQAKELDEQAKVCGSSMFSRLAKIIFPNAKNGMMSVWVILFTLFMTELSTSIFLYTTNSRVITVTIFELWRTAQYGSLAALSTLQVLITFTVVFSMITLFDIDIRAV
ncbi:MAG: ABC transporter permease [Haloferacaceae archaeon]